MSSPAEKDSRLAEQQQTETRPKVLIVGASTRAAAWSALRGGYRPCGADQFADMDLRQIAEVVPVRDYPASLSDDLSTVSADYWLFVGAMENHRHVLRRLQTNSCCGRYCGPSWDAIQQVRDPRCLRERLRPLGCYPDILMPDDAADGWLRMPEGRWLRKPVHGGGGRGIEPVTKSCLQPLGSEPCYWQQQLAGDAFSAFGIVHHGAFQLMMVSRQLTGLSAAGAPTLFTYCGSIGPWPISPEMSAQLTAIGSILVDGLDYRGLIGIDFLLDGPRTWVVEVNPRYPASAELWDWATGGSAVAEHLRACFGDSRPVVFSNPSSVFGNVLLGKLILYADRPVCSPELACCLKPQDARTVPWIADIPGPESVIARGWPICTVFASSHSGAEACLEKLLRRSRRVRSWFRDL